MRIANLINHHNIAEFQIMLKSNIFSKNDIEEFLKANPECSDDYINQISEYVCEKYKNEISIYLEIAKYYLNKNIKESISAKNKQKLKNIFIEVDKSVGNDKKQLLNKMFIELISEVKNEKNEHIILKIIENLKKLNSINEIDIKNIKQDFLKYYVNSYIETADNVFMNTITDVVKSDNKDLYTVFNEHLQLKIKNLNNYSSEKAIQKVLNIFKNTHYIIVESNQYNIMELVLAYYKKDVVKTVMALCLFFNKNNTNWKLSNELTLILRQEVFSLDQKNKIIKILKENYKNSTNIKTKNIFLNEIEILEKKTYLKSMPRVLDVTVTTRCNVRCIMCNMHELDDYSIDDRVFRYIKKLIPYLESIVWKGGEVFLYDKFYKLLKLANKHNVQQTIITNGLLLTKNNIELLGEYKVQLVISIDSADQKTYEKIRAGSDFNRLVHNLKMLQKYKKKNKLFSYQMNVVVMSVNYIQIEDNIKFAILYNFKRLTFQNCASCKNSYLLLQDVQKKETIDKIEEYRNKYKDKIEIIPDASLDINYYAKFHPPVKEEQSFVNQNKVIDKKIFCYRPFYKMILNPERNNINFGCGCTTIDISKYQYNDIWNCECLVKYRQSILNGDLSVCSL